MQMVVVTITDVPTLSTVMPDILAVEHSLSKPTVNQTDNGQHLRKLAKVGVIIFSLHFCVAMMGYERR